MADRSEDGAPARGSTTLVALFLFLIFSVFGLGLITLTKVSLLLSGHKRNAVIQGYLAENAVKQSLGHAAESMAGRSLPVSLEDGRLEELRNNAVAGGIAASEEAVGLRFPFSIQGGEGGQTWEGSVSCRLERLEEFEDFILCSYQLDIEGLGRLADVYSEQTVGLGAGMEVAAGRIPLALFPFLALRPDEPGDAADYLRNRNISITSQGSPPGYPLLSFVAPALLPRDAIPALNEALRIKIFRPQDLTPRVLRRALGLEESDEAVPDGVYLIETDLGLGGIYVQGDLDELLLATSGDSQIIHFRQAGFAWRLEFSTARGQTSFTAPDETRSFNTVPAGTVVVAGAIKSLAGGEMDGAGTIVPSADGFSPSVLTGVNLTIVSSHSMTLTSHLTRQGVSWQDGVPYIKDSASRLNLFCVGADLSSGEDTEGSVIIGETAPDGLRLEAAIASPGRGLVLEGSGKTVKLMGSVQASDVRNTANSLEIFVEPWRAQDLRGAASLPRTTSPILLATRLQAREWREGQ